MRHRYFIGTGPQADVLIARCEEMKGRRSATIAAVNAEFAPGRVVIDGPAAGIAFEKAADHAQRRWLKSLGSIETADGVWHVYEAKPANPRGRRLAELLADPSLVFDASDYIVNTFGMAVSSDGGSLSTEQSEAAYIGNRIFVTVPTGDGIMPPAPPAWLKNVGEAEFVGEWRKSA